MSNFVSYENGQTLFGAVGEKFDDVFATMGANGAKNLLANTASSTSINNVTFTVNADGSVTVNTGSGGASANAELTIMQNNKDIPNGGGIVLSGCPAGGANDKYFLFARIGNDDGDTYAGGVDDYGSSSNIPSYNKSTQHIRFGIRIISGQQVSNLTFKPMVRLATDPDSTYAPYAMTNKQLTDALAYLEQTVTLSTSAATAVTFTDARITANSCIEVGTSEWGLVPDSVTVSAGSCVVTLPQAETAHSAVCRIYLR